MKKNRSRSRSPIHFIAYLFLLVAVFLITEPAQSEVSCPSDITSYWMLDESSGTTFTDSIGGHDAGCIGSACPGFTSGRIGGALLFDGIDDAMNVPPDASFNWGSGASFSIEFWMKTDTASSCNGNEVIIGRDDSSTNLHWWVGCWDSTGVAAFRLNDKNGTSTLAFGSSDITDGKWHHVVAMRNATTSENSIYVDGKLEGSANITYSSGFDSATASLNIGWLNLDDFYHFAGKIDEIALYSRALTENEIMQHYFDGSVGLEWGYCPDCGFAAGIMPLGDSITRGSSA